MFCIMVRVSGGVTGTREALYKAAGKVMEFATKEAAEEEAAAYRRSMNRHNNGVAYHAWIVELEADGEEDEGEEN